VSEDTARAVPVHGRFRGAVDLLPAEAHGAWECRLGARVLDVRLMGLVVRG